MKQLSSETLEVFDWSVMLPYIQENATNICTFLLITLAMSIYTGRVTKSTSSVILLLTIVLGSAVAGIDTESRKQIEKKEMLDFKSYLEKLSNSQLELYVNSPEINERSKEVAREVLSGRKKNASESSRDQTNAYDYDSIGGKR